VQDVLAGKRVMQQSLFTPAPAPGAEAVAETLRAAVSPGLAWALPVSVAALVTALAALIAALAR
jgi:hypothetical protein